MPSPSASCIVVVRVKGKLNTPTHAHTRGDRAPRKLAVKEREVGNHSPLLAGLPQVAGFPLQKEQEEKKDDPALLSTHTHAKHTHTHKRSKEKNDERDRRGGVARGV
jgi:hypothetical protein